MLTDTQKTQRRAVPVSLDRERWVVFDTAAIAALKREHGINLLDEATLSRLFDERATPDPEAILALIWAGLRADEPGLTVDAAGALVPFDRLGDVFATIVKARVDQAPKSTAKDGAPAGPPEARAGSSS